MDVNKDSIRVGGYILTPDPHASDRGAAARFAQSELRRFADANARRAITALHDDAQRLLPRHLAGTATNPGMAVSTRTGTLVTRLGFEAAAEEIALVRSVSSPPPNATSTAPKPSPPTFPR